MHVRSEAADWSPVLMDDDPTPGRVGEVRTMTAQLTAICERLHRQADAVEKSRQKVTAPNWSGMAAETFERRLVAVVAAFRAAAVQHDLGAQYARRWADDLEAAQGQADAALAEAEQAKQELEEAEAALSAAMGMAVDLQGALSALERTRARYSGTTPPSGTTVPTAADITAARAKVGAAEHAQLDARRRIEASFDRLSRARASAELARENFHVFERAFTDSLASTLTGAPDWEDSTAEAFRTTVTAVATVDMAGSDLLAGLRKLTPAQWKALLKANPQLVWAMTRNPPAPDAVAHWWKTLTPAERQALVKAIPGVLGNLDGVPFTVRDTCNREVLKRALKDPRAVYNGLDPRHRPGSLADFTREVEALRDAFVQADDDARRLPGSADNRVAQLVQFGTMHGAVTAAISQGNLDTATNVVVNIPGATSTISGGMANQLRAGLSLLVAAAQKNASASYASVTWFGYRAPDAMDVGAMGPAQSGAAALSGFLDGIHTGRTGGPPQQLTVTAHSYGSTTAAEALKKVTYPVDDFVSYGSVGFVHDTHRSDLRAGDVYATEADADGTADWGRNLSLWTRTDPREIDGVIPFSSEKGRGTSGATGHDLYPEFEVENDGRKVMVPDPDHVGYLTSGSTSQKATAGIVGNGRP